MKPILALLILAASISASSVQIQVDNPACNSSQDILGTIQNFPACMIQSFFSQLTNGLTATAQTFLSSAFSLISASPNLNWFCLPYNSIMQIIESLYTLAIMGLGVYFILRSNDIEGRLACKKWLQNLFLMILILAFAFPIFKLLLDANTSITQTLLSQAQLNFLDFKANFTDYILAIVMLLMLTSAALLSFLTLLFRYLLIPVILLLFPFAIMLYFIPITEGFGRFLIKLILLVLFMSSIDALLILAFSSIFSSPDPNLSSGLIRLVAAMGALGAIGLANLAIYIIAVLMALQQGLKLAGEAIGHAVRLAILASVL